MIRKAKIEDFYKMLRSNLPLLLIYTALLLTLPLFAILNSNEVLPYSSLFYQILGIWLLYMDEKFKMSRNEKIFGKLNTSFIKILESPYRIKFALVEIYRYKTNFYKEKNCEVNAEFSVTHINHDYSKIENKEERFEKMIDSFKSDLGSLRYFSAVRKAGYVILSIGFIQQFFTYILNN